jgi:predicted NUDIX family NTP pyrophosphohydrolase
MSKMSAGILMFRNQNQTEVLLAHPGGPFWAKKQFNSWSIPKGEFTEEEEPLAAALREVEEETGLKLSGDFISFEPFKIKSGKTIYCFAIQADPDLSNFTSNTFEMEWPPRSGKKSTFPEVDKIEWFTIEEAEKRITESQLPVILQLKNLLDL